MFVIYKYVPKLTPVILLLFMSLLNSLHYLPLSALAPTDKPRKLLRDNRAHTAAIFAIAAITQLRLKLDTTFGTKFFDFIVLCNLLLMKF